ncbi:MAG TPA: hypothetical protein VFO10_10070 [Oligoflexus sp.]|uniref:hypothetical protein n=1 Tax=Oligoflexus sp. TaxID=1971216 RepID=UPI002D7F18BC|nr:hypothetical protein [Oligoflexus sp.]HET9237587.1 hypothetical protein [Oligoflexus sp.]
MLHILLRIALCVFLHSGCAVLYKVQLSDMEYAPRGKPVSVKVSEMTVDFGEAARVAGKLGAAAGSRGLQNIGSAAEYYETYFQFGPRTGTPVFNEFYARDVPERLAAECKGGYLTNVTSIRESREYSFVKGQIVRVDATCVQP